MSRSIIVDVREPEEFAADHVPGAINIPPLTLMSNLGELAHVPKNTEVILYCRTGNRSNAAANILRSHGFTNLKNGINKEHVMTHLAHF